MARSTKKSWLEGPGDLREADVEDVPVQGESVRVRGLAAAFSNQAASEALEMVTTPKGDQIARVNTEKLEVLQFAHGCIEPSFSTQEAQQIAEKFGPAFKKVVAKIDELSGVDKDAIQEAGARFPSSGEGETGESWMMELAPGVPDPLFLHELALDLGMTIQDIGERMSAHELCVLWPAYYEYRRRVDDANQMQAQTARDRIG